MDASKAACAKVPKPGLPHFTWAKNSEVKGAQALDAKDWPKAEKAYTDAKLFYDQAAGKK